MPVEPPAETFNAPAPVGPPPQGAGAAQPHKSGPGHADSREGARIVPGEPGRVTLEVQGEILKDDGKLQLQNKDKNAPQAQYPKFRVTIPANMLAPAPTIILPPQIAPGTNGSVYGHGRDPRRSSVLPGIQP